MLPIGGFYRLLTESCRSDLFGTGFFASRPRACMPYVFLVVDMVLR